jgi:hypothetical protein
MQFQTVFILFSSYNILLRTTWLLQNNIRAIILIRERQLTRARESSACVSLRSEFHYEFSNKTMFGSSLPPAVCRRRVHVLVTLFENSCVQHILCCVMFLFCFSSSYVTYGASFSSLSIFDCSFGIFSNVYLLVIISLSKLTSEKKHVFWM